MLQDESLVFMGENERPGHQAQTQKQKGARGELLNQKGEVGIGESGRRKMGALMKMPYPPPREKRSAEYFDPS